MKIGIIGLQGAGKNTFAELLLTHLEHDFSVIGRDFGTPLHGIAEHCGCSNLREYKEVAVTRMYPCFDERLYTGIEQHLGGLSDNTKAAIFAYMLDALEDGGYLVRGYGCDMLTISPRRFMQLLGTEAGRRAREELWVDYWKDQTSGYDFAIAADVRFHNEADACDLLIHVVNWRINPPPCNHESEAAYKTLAIRAWTVVRNESSIIALNDVAAMAAADLKESKRGK